MTIPPLEIQQHGAFDLGRHLYAPMPVVESVAANRMRCPSCNLPVAAPAASTYLRAEPMEDVWHCSGCGLEWRSGFGGLRS